RYPLPGPDSFSVKQMGVLSTFRSVLQPDARSHMCNEASHEDRKCNHHLIRRAKCVAFISFNFKRMKT
ncbi:hypothetical protein XENOCAPTIV_007710, partial [Xenoophorus captivus]